MSESLVWRWSIVTVSAAETKLHTHKQTHKHTQPIYYYIIIEMYMWSQSGGFSIPPPAFFFLRRIQRVCVWLIMRVCVPTIRQNGKRGKKEYSNINIHVYIYSIYIYIYLVTFTSVDANISKLDAVDTRNFGRWFIKVG